MIWILLTAGELQCSAILSTLIMCPTYFFETDCFNLNCLAKYYFLMWGNVWIVWLFWVVVERHYWLIMSLVFAVLSINLEVNSGPLILNLWYCGSRCLSWKVVCSVCQGLIQCVWFDIVCISICQNFQTVICMTPDRPCDFFLLHTTLLPTSAVFAAKMVVLLALIDCGSSLIGNTNCFGSC